jgi:hypothetical protein
MLEGQSILAHASISTEELNMTVYQYHWWPSRTARGSLAPSISLHADSHLHGAALALRHFRQLGCDITAPLAHLDMIEPDGVKQTLLVEEVLEWLNHPHQIDFRHREDLTVLLH